MKRTLAAFLALLTLLMLTAGCKKDYEKYVTLGEYKGIKAETTEVTVSDSEVADAVKRTLDAYGESTQVTDRKAEDGDEVTIAFVGRLAADDSLFEGGSSDSYQITLGSGQFIDGFEEGVVGMMPGDTKDIELNFPDPYPRNPDLAGVPVIFEVTLISITDISAPEYTDEWVASVSTSTTIEEYEQFIYDALLKSKQDTERTALRENVWKIIFDSCEISGYPQKKLEKSQTTLTEYYESQAAENNMTMEQYATVNYGLTEAEFTQAIVAWSKSEVGSYMVSDSIAAIEGISVSDEEYEAGKQSYIEQYGYADEAAFIEAAGASFEETFGKDVIMGNLLFQKVVDFCIEQADITVVPAE